MKKYFKCILLFLMIIYYGNAQWMFQRPHPTGENLNASQFLDSNTGFIAGGYGIFMKTTNGGANWSINEHVNGTNENFTSLFFLNSTTGWIAGAKIYKTTNQGFTWTEKVISNYTNFTNIYFTDENTGYISGNLGFVLKTSDGGINWEYLTNCYYNNSLFFANANTFWVASYQDVMNGRVSNVKKTTNAGVTWVNQIDTNDYFTETHKVFFINDYTGWVTGRSLKKTTNGGNNWNTIYTGGGNCVVFFNENQGFMQVSGCILYTSNSGYTWSESHCFGQVIASLSSVNSNNVFLSGLHGLIAKTTNSGINWLELSEGIIGRFSDVFFIDNNTGWFIGDNSTLLKTTNGGSTFIDQNPGVGTGYPDFSNVFFLNQNTGWICGEHLVLKTTNGGTNWVTLNNTEEYFTSIYFIDENTGWLTGDPIGSYLWKTTDGGAQWQQIPLSNPNIGSQTCIKFININTGFVTGYYGIKRTSNGGVNWAMVSSVGVLIKIHVVDYNNIFFLSSSSVWKSTNVGITWNMIFTGGPAASYYSVFFTNQYTGYLPSYYERVMLKTTDGGYTWGQQQFSGRYTRDIFFVNESLGWVCTGNGDILRTTNGGGPIIGINQTIETLPVKSGLSQNYPNPFNPQTKIKFDIPANVKGQMSNVKLIIYDLLGREVTILVNEELKPGTYEADWDGSNYSSGVYFYKIISGDFVETKKMVLMK